MKKTIKNMYGQIEESLGDSIFKMCQIYDESLYNKIITAYFLLGKMEVLFDKTNKSFMSAISLISTQTLINIIIRKFISNEHSLSTKANLPKINAYIEELKKKDYNELHAQISSNEYKNCLIDLCTNLWQLMKNYYKMCNLNYNNFIENNESQISQSKNKLFIKAKLRTFLKLNFFFQTHGLVLLR